MEALRQQLEVQRESRDHADNHTDYMQALSSLREALQDNDHQRQLDAVVGQLQELHLRQLQQLYEQHQHDTALQVTATRVTVEQVHASRLKLVEEEHSNTLQRLDKQHKDDLNALQAKLSSTQGHSGQQLDDVPSFCISEELMQQYQNLVQKINQSLETEVLDCLHKEDERHDEAEVEGKAVPHNTISTQQVEAIQQILQAQQEEVLSLRSRLLQEYDAVLKERSEEVSQQTQEVQRLQNQMAELQSQYEQQIADFQSRISQCSEKEEYQQKQEAALDDMKARYEQRISDLEESFSQQISSLQHSGIPSAAQGTAREPVEVNDGGDSGSAQLHILQTQTDMLEKEQGLVQNTSLSNIASDAATDSPSLQESSLSNRLQQLQDTVQEKTSLVVELEKSLGEEREKTSDLLSQLDTASQKLGDLSGQLEQQEKLIEKLQESLKTRDHELEQALQEKAESEKLLQELNEKETALEKEKDQLSEELRHLQEVDETLLTSTPTVEGELKQLRISLEETTSALKAVEAREVELREKLLETQHQHAEALEELRQELEHEAQMERETLQSEFLVQLDVELKRQAAEMERKFSEHKLQNGQKSSELDVNGDEVDVGSVPDTPHAAECVQTALVASANIHPTRVNGDLDYPDTVIHQFSQPWQSSVSTEKSLTKADVPADETDTDSVHPTTASVDAVTSGATAQGSESPTGRDVSKPDSGRWVCELCQQLQAEKARLVQDHEQRVAELETSLCEAEERYTKLKEDVEEREGAGVDTLLKDRYDLELDLAKNLMQQEFDETLQAEKKKFVERHRQLMDDFMADHETEAEEVKEKHKQELEELETCLNAQITELQTELQQYKTSQQNDQDKLLSSDELNVDELKELKAELVEVKEKLEASQSDYDEAVQDLENVREQLKRTCSDLEETKTTLTDLQESKAQLERLKVEHAEALTALIEEQEAKIEELKCSHQEEVEAVALDSDVVKSDLEQAHQAEVQQLREQLQAQAACLQDQAQLSPVTQALTGASESSREEGRVTPETHIGLEYEETDDGGSDQSLSTTLDKSHSFADDSKSPRLLVSPHQEERVKQLEAQIERLTMQLVQQQPLDLLARSNLPAGDCPPVSSQASPSSPALSQYQGAKPKIAQLDGGDHNLLNLLQSDLDRISAERDSVQQTNNRLLQLLSDSVHTYVEVEDTINRRLHTVVTASAPRPQTPTHSHRPDMHADLVTPRGAGMSFISLAGERGGAAGAAAMSSPQSDRSWRQRDADTSSPTLEETSILSNATDEGLDMSQRLTESIFTGPDIDAEGEEIVSDARGRLQNAVTRLLEMIERTTQQLLEAKATQTDLLETVASRSRDNDDLSTRLRDLEEQVRQEVAAKEYLGLELHKAEGLISGYSSEREALEEQLQSLEEQKEVLASDLETTRSRLQEFQEATGELEARRQDVERQQSLLQENSGQEAQESAMAGDDATVSEQKALLKEMDSVKQETREQTLQLQHRLTQAEHGLQERESSMEEMEKEHQHQREELQRQVEDLRLQLDSTERQLKANKHFLDEQMSEREQEREDFLKEVDKLQHQLHDKEKQTDSESRLQHEIQDLTEQLQARIESQSLMHQQTRDLQQSLQERDLSAQDLRVWINTLERELDQRGDTEEQLKGRIQKLERRLTIGESDIQSDTSVSPVLTPRPDSPNSVLMSPPHLGPQRRESRISLEDELRKSRQAEEELVHEKEALQKQVQEQLLQISALRNQLDEMRHWTGTPDPNASSSSAADLREQLDTEREKLEKAEEELSSARADQEELQALLQDKTQEVEHLKQQVNDSLVSASRLSELEEERISLQAQISDLSSVGPFPPELLDEKNAEIEELRHQLSKTETDLGSLQAEMKEKEELLSDLQDTVHSLQRGETCLDVSLSFNEPLPLNASFTERLQEEERPSSVTSLAQELDQSVGDRELRIAELTADLNQLNEQLSEQQEQLDQLQEDKTALQSQLLQRDEDLSQLQEERSQKQEALVEKESRLQQLVEQINSLQTEITSLTSFQVELQKDFDTVQSMLDEKEGEIESLTKELLESRSQTEGSDVSDLEAELAAVQRQLREQRNVVDEKEEELYELSEKLEAMEGHQNEVQLLKTQLAEQTAKLEQEQKSSAELRDQLAEKSKQLQKESESDTDLQKELAEKDGQLEEERKSLAKLREEVAEKISQLEEERNTHAKLQEEIAENHGQLEEERKSHAKLQEDLAEKVDQLEEERKSHAKLQEEMAGKIEELEEARKSQAEMAEKDNQLEEDRKSLTKLQEEVVPELRAEVSRLQSIVKDKEELIQCLEDKLADGDLKEEDVKELRQQLNNQHDSLTAKITQLETALSQHDDVVEGKQREVDNLEQQLRNQTDKVQQLELEQQALQQQVEELRATITSLQTDSSLLKQQLGEAKKESIATDDMKTLQEKFQQAAEQIVDLERQVTTSQTRLEQTSTQLNEREEQIQQLQAEVQNLHQECQRLQASHTPEHIARPRTPDSEDSETDERLKDVISRAQYMQSSVCDSLSSSLPVSANTEVSNLSRWESEPGLSSSVSPQEKETLIASLKRELAESRELLAATERASVQTSSYAGSQSLSPQTKQQIAHLRSELQRAKAALAALQDQSTTDSEVTEDRGHIEKLEEELRLLRASASVSAQDFMQKVEEMRQELSQEHERHIAELQESAHEDLEAKLTELQSRHDQETQQLQQIHQRTLDQALAQQQQELEKEHKTELNHLKVQHQQEIDRLRNEELASLTEASVAQQLHADVSATQQMDQNMIGQLNTDNGDAVTEPCPPHIQALLDRLREAGEHILSVSELDLLQRHISPAQDMTDGLHEAWQGEKLALANTVQALKDLLSQVDHVKAGLDESGSDWRSDLIHALVEVYKQECQALQTELHTVRLQHSQQQYSHAVKNLDNRLHEQEQLHQSGLDAMLRAERQSLLSELEHLRTCLSQQRQEQQDLQSRLTESLAQQEESASNKTWKLQREVQVLEYKLQQEKVIEEDLKKSLESERRRVAELSSEVSRDKGSLISMQSELQSTQLHLSRIKDALEREQNRFTSVTDALEEEREKNNRLADMLETLRRQHSTLESDRGRSEVIRRERETAENRFIKELQQELASERDQLHKAEEVAEEERRQRKQVQGELEREQQHTNTVKQELEKLRRQTKKSLEAEVGKVNETQRLVQKEQEKVQELQRLLAERDGTILQHTHVAQQLHTQVKQLKSKCSNQEKDLELEREKGDSLVTLMDKERQQHLKLQQQEQSVSAQLRKELSKAKSENGESRHNIEMEKSRCDNLRLELDRAQSELRALSQHAGATERQLETEHTSTWNKLQSAQKDRDQQQVKVHELELELDRLQDRLQDLELELDRSRQRELEARHDVERHKLYPSASPRSAPTTPRGDSELQSRLNTFCQQLQSVGQRLHTLTLRQRDHNITVTDSEGAGTEAGRNRSAVETLMAELRILQQKMAAGDQPGAVVSVSSARQDVEELQATISQLQSEKEELQRQLALLQDEHNIRTPRTARNVNVNNHHQETLPQYVSDVTMSDDDLTCERSLWASERSNLQVALDSAEHEIDRLKKELRSFRGRFNSEGFMVEADRDKMQRIYGKYLRAESFRKALVYQKKYLLLLLGGYQDSEQETLAVIATMGGQPSSTLDLAMRRRHHRLYSMFRSAARMVVAIFRMKYLVRRWKRAMRIGSPVVSGRINQQYGYVATASAFSPVNDAERHPTNSATSTYVNTLHRTPNAVSNGNSVVRQQHGLSLQSASERGRQFHTPPTKEFSQSQRVAVSPASASARRQLMGDLDKSHNSSSGSDDNGGAGGTAACHDDFIQRLQNVQSRLSATKNGEPSRSQSWR